MRVGPVVLVALLVLAGCGGIVDTTPTETPESTSTDAPPETTVETVTPTETATDTPTATPAPTATPTPTPTPTSTPTETDSRTLSADNPWGQRVVPVAVNDTVADGRNTTAIVERSLAYWNANMDRYTDHSFRFELTDDPDRARVEVRYVEAIPECDGPRNNTAGCARYIRPGEDARDLEVAKVISDGSNSFLEGTTKHELGHLLGLHHDDDPQFLLAQRSETPVRNATDRANPWYSDTVAVAVEYDTFDLDRDAVDAQVGHAVDYYDDGASGTVPENVTATRTDAHHAAEVLVTNDRDVCTVEGGSQPRIRGENLDHDDAMEAYSRATVCVDIDDEDAVGWHVGAALGAAFGLSEDELATPFRDAGYRERRSAWWE